MNIYDLLESNSGVNITLNAGQLIDAIDYCVEKTRCSLEKIIQDEAAEKYLSIEKAAELLDVDKSTLWRWNKSDYLKPILLGGKRRYRLSDINKILMKG